MDTLKEANKYNAAMAGIGRISSEHNGIAKHAGRAIDYHVANRPTVQTEEHKNDDDSDSEDPAEARAQMLRDWRHELATAYVTDDSSIAMRLQATSSILK